MSCTWRMFVFGAIAVVTLFGPVVCCNCCRRAPFAIIFCSKSTDEQAAPAGASGWMQQLLTKVLANMSIEVSLTPAWQTDRTQASDSASL